MPHDRTRPVADCDCAHCASRRRVIVAASARFWSKVDKDHGKPLDLRDLSTGCWEWVAGTSWGYGQFSLQGGNIQAHRYAYELLVGPIPEGLDIDHLCMCRRCVNPAHLEPVTRGENNVRGTAAFWREVA